MFFQETQEEDVMEAERGGPGGEKCHRRESQRGWTETVWTCPGQSGGPDEDLGGGYDVVREDTKAAGVREEDERTGEPETGDSLRAPQS